MKIDISKAYDKVGCKYLSSSILKLGFDERLVNMIMLCFTFIKYSMALNGAKFGLIFP